MIKKSTNKLTKTEKHDIKMSNFLNFVLFHKMPKFLKRKTGAQLLDLHYKYIPILRSEQATIPQMISALIILYVVEEELNKRHPNLKYLRVSNNSIQVIMNLVRKAAVLENDGKTS